MALLSVGVCWQTWLIRISFSYPLKAAPGFPPWEVESVSHRLGVGRRNALDSVFAECWWCISLSSCTLGHAGVALDSGVYFVLSFATQ